MGEQTDQQLRLPGCCHLSGPWGNLPVNSEHHQLTFQGLSILIPTVSTATLERPVEARESLV